MNIKKTATIITISLGLLAAAALSMPTLAVAPEQQTTVEEGTDTISCATPHPHNEASCQAMEAKIMSSTVRLLMYSPLMYVEGSGMRIISGMGHGTIKDGRYLVTHNHYDQTLFDMMLAGDPEDLLTIEIMNTNGEYLTQVTGQGVAVVQVENETVVFDFGTRDGEGLFSALGLTSTEFLPQSELALTAGMELAQIDWDGATTHIDWVRVEELTEKDNTPIFRVDNCIKKGASGGGVFLNGVHVGNNWSRQALCDNGVDTGIAPYTSVAFNSDVVVGR